MEAYIIQGGHRLNGAVQIHGAKNSVLPILAACVCCAGVCEIHNCPRITDVDTAVAILEHLGCGCTRESDVLRVDAGEITRTDIPPRLMRDMRSSVLFLGALLMRCGEADLVYPGGCALGERPIDLHIDAMKRFGAECRESCERVYCTAARLRACELNLRCPSVGATENAMLAALGAVGESTIRNAAKEPEISDLARFLRALGAKISGEGTSEITIQGNAKLQGTAYSVMPDRIETATYLCAAAGCGGDVFLRGAQRRGTDAVLSVLGRAGCVIMEEDTGLRISAAARLNAVGNIITEPYPGFPTDAQAPMMAALLRSAGTTGFTETIFENRLRHVPELQKLGANISVFDRRALVRGVETLSGAPLYASDLRCGAALIIAALQAEGESRISGVGYIHRGYEGLCANFCGIGAQIALYK